MGLSISTEKGNLITHWKVGYPVPTGFLSAEKTLKFTACGTELELIINALRSQDSEAFRAPK